MAERHPADEIAQLRRENDQLRIERDQERAARETAEKSAQEARECLSTTRAGLRVVSMELDRLDSVA